MTTLEIEPRVRDQNLTDLLLAVLLDDDADEWEVTLLLGDIVLDANELEVELEVHAVAKQGLQHYRPGIVVLLSTAATVGCDQHNLSESVRRSYHINRTNVHAAAQHDILHQYTIHGSCALPR